MPTSLQNRKTAIYARVSTDAQREEGYSIDAQKEMAEAFVKSKGIKNFEFYVDGGFSGSNLERPALQKLINDVKSGKIGTVVVYKLDRLSRSQKDTLYLIEDIFNPNNVDFISMNESMDTSTPLGRLMLGILSAFAQLERENIKERTRMGMKERVKSGLWMGGGRIPFGYDYDKENGILVPNDDAKNVKKAYQLYLEGYSTAKIARILGLKYEKLAYQILKRKSNAGYITYNGEEYKGMHEPIISEEVYNKTMEMMERRSDIRRQNSNYLLTGLIICGKCGAKMRYQKWGKDKCKIVCYSKDKSKPHLVKDENCDNPPMEAAELENAVIEDLFLFSLKKENGKNEEEVLSVTDILKEKYSQNVKKLKRLYDLYAKSDDDILLDTIEELRKETEKSKNLLEAEQNKSSKIKNKVKLKAKLETIRDTWKYMSKEEQRTVICSVLEKIVVNGDEVNIYYKF